MELLALQVYEQYPDTFKESKILSDDVKGRLASLSHNMMFCGLNFGSTPKLAFEPLIIIPIFAFVLSLVQTVLSQYLNKKNNPEMANAGGAGMKVMLYIMPLFSLWISFSVPAGVGFYWGVNYALGIVQSLVMQKLYSPEKLRAEAEEKMKERKLKERQVTTTAVVTDADTGERKDRNKDRNTFTEGNPTDVSWRRQEKPMPKKIRRRIPRRRRRLRIDGKDGLMKRYIQVSHLTNSRRLPYQKSRNSALMKLT